MNWQCKTQSLSKISHFLSPVLSVYHNCSAFCHFHPKINSEHSAWSWSIHVTWYLHPHGQFFFEMFKLHWSGIPCFADISHF